MPNADLESRHQRERSEPEGRYRRKQPRRRWAMHPVALRAGHRSRSASRPRVSRRPPGVTNVRMGEATHPGVIPDERWLSPLLPLMWRNDLEKVHLGRRCGNRVQARCGKCGIRLSRPAQECPDPAFGLLRMVLRDIGKLVVKKGVFEPVERRFDVAFSVLFPAMRGKPGTTSRA